MTDEKFKSNTNGPHPVPVELIERRIFLIRGQKVMLDRDLADLYSVKPIRLREQVKRNRRRFPDDFIFQLTDKEVEFMVSQNAIPSRKYLGGYLPYVFTEHGVAMLSSVLNSQCAVQMNILIIRAFVKLREMMSTHKELARKIDDIERQQKEHGRRLNAVYSIVKQLINVPPKAQNPIGFKTGGRSCV